MLRTKKTHEQKYRYYIKDDYGNEYHVFESRYYAQKYIDIELMPIWIDSDFEIQKADDGFVIYKIDRVVI